MSSKCRCSVELVAKLVILLVAILGVSSIISVLCLLEISTPVFKSLIALIGVVLVVVSVLGWKMVVLSFEPVVVRANPVLLRAYGYDFSNFPPHAQPRLMTVPVTGAQNPLPSPLFYPDPTEFGAPTMMAPPPPTYQQAERQVQLLAMSMPGQRSPPPDYCQYNELPISSRSPPPSYPRRETIQSPLTSPTTNRSNGHVAIDCSKAEPTIVSVLNTVPDAVIYV